MGGRCVGQECPTYENRILHALIVFKEIPKLFNFCHRDAAVQVGSDIMRFRWWAVIDVAANVQVPLFLLQFFERHDSGILVEVLPSPIDLSDLLNVFRTQRVLVLAFLEFSIRIDEQHVFAFGGSVLVDHQHTGRNTGAVKEVARQTNHRFQNAVFDELLTTGFLFAASKQHAVRHDHRHLAIDFSDATMCCTNIRSAFLPLSGMK